MAGCATSADPSHSVETATEAQTKFGIFLTADLTPDTIPDRLDLAHVQLAPSPVISADDVINYDFSTHSMKLRLEALARIPNPPVHGLPFVVVADGQRIYVGAFWTDISSIPSHVPTITVNKSSFDKSEASAIQIVHRAYPTDAFGKGPDPRNDPRIKSALAALHKLN